MAAEVREMPGTQTVEQVQIDSAIKERVMPLFSELGLDMSEAVNIFLHQCLLHGGLPFSVELPHFSAETLEAMAEARRISRDPSVKSYASVEELKKALDESLTNSNSPRPIKGLINA